MRDDVRHLFLIYHCSYSSHDNEDHKVPRYKTCEVCAVNMYAFNGYRRVLY